MSDVLIDHLFSLLVDSSKPDSWQRILNDQESGKSEEVKWEDGLFSFTLKGLHQMVQTIYDVEFKDFQQRLYAGNLNERLTEVGLSVVVHQSTGKVASNWYQVKTL
ncbi:hypothetical protein ACFOEK_08135 [Litoribrevibacter euphylliae]|uniref:Uncharacterized protein n=1 Tax=Litoribrevibacter euphylliae TaxID=1834034 RepID=A0ABV7HAN8_9GAMM